MRRGVVVGRTLAVSAVVALSGFACSIIAARALGVEGRGTFATLVLIATLAGVAGQLGIGNVIAIRYRQGIRGPAAVIATIGTLSCSLGVGFALIFALSVGLPTSAAAATCLYGGVLSLQSFLLSATQSDVNLKSHNWLRFWSSVLAVGAYGIVWGAAGDIPELFVISQAAVIGTVSIAVGRVLARDLRLPGKRVFSPLLTKPDWHLAGGFYGVVVLGSLVSNLEKLYFVLKPNLVEFGLYSIAYSASRMLMMLQSSLSTVIFARLAGTSDVKASADLVKRGLAWTFPTVMLLAVVLAAGSKWVIPFLYGEEYERAALPFALLCVESVFAGSAWLLAQHFSAIGRPWVNLLRQAVSMTPLLIVILTMPFERPSTNLATGMLLSATLRLAITYVLLPRDRRESKWIGRSP